MKIYKSLFHLAALFWLVLLTAGPVSGKVASGVFDLSGNSCQQKHDAKTLICQANHEINSKLASGSLDAPKTGTALKARRASELDEARINDLGVNHEQGGRIDLAEGIGGARYEDATGNVLTRSKVEGIDFFDGDKAISLKGPLVNKNTGQSINITDNHVDGLADSVIKDAKYNSASDAIIVDTSGMTSVQRIRLKDKIDAGLDGDGVNKEIVILE